MLNTLTSQQTSNSLAHYAKGTPSPNKWAPTDCKHTVSGTISLPSLGCFSPFPHGTGSLSVTREYLALDSGLPRFRQDFTCPALLGNQLQGDYFFSPTGLSPTMVGLSRTIRLKNSFLTPRTLCTELKVDPATPKTQRAQALTCFWFRLFPVRSPLLGESQLLSLPGGTEMVHFPPLAPTGLYIQPEVTRHYPSRVAPFGNPRV